MQLFKASEKDSEELKSFFSEQIVDGVYDYQLQRPNSFFDQYRLSTDDFQTFVLKDQESKIQALASILFKKAYINDQEQTVGYVTDLRVSSARIATLTWAKEFIPRIDRERKERNCKVIFSELEQYENVAYNTLLRRRKRGSLMPRYHLFRKFYVTVMYGKSLLAEEPLDSIRIDYGKTEDVEPLCQYLQEKAVRRPLRYKLTPEDFEERCRIWPNFSVQNFLVARNYQGKIIGCMAPWNNRDIQKIIINKYKGKSLQVFNTSRTLSPFGITRPFAKPGEALKLKHITHGAYDNPDIFYSLLSRAYDDCQNQELLIYLNYHGDYATRPPQSFLNVKIPYGLYSVLDNETKLPNYLHPNPFTPPPSFQISYF